MQYDQIVRKLKKMNDIALKEKTDGNLRVIEVKFIKDNREIEGYMRKDWNLGPMGSLFIIFQKFLKLLI